MKDKSILKTLASTLILATSARLSLQAQTSTAVSRRTVGRTLADSKEWWPEPVKAPAGAPNVVWILLGRCGLWRRWNIRRTHPYSHLRQLLPSNGLRYTNFHTCAICAPTRAALLTGRNSATVHESGFSHTIMSAGFPGWDGRMPCN
jgi:hypothetical protein